MQLRHSLACIQHGNVYSFIPDLKVSAILRTLLIDLITDLMIPQLTDFIGAVWLPAKGRCPVIASVQNTFLFFLIMQELDTEGVVSLRLKAFFESVFHAFGNGDVGAARLLDHSTDAYTFPV